MSEPPTAIEVSHLVKIYGGVTTENFETIEDGIKECDTRLDAYLQSFKKEAT